MTLPDCRLRWRIDRRFAYLTSGALPHAIDVLSGVSLRLRSPRCRACKNVLCSAQTRTTTRRGAK